MVELGQSPTQPDPKWVGSFISVIISDSCWARPHPTQPIATPKSTLIIGVCGNFIDIHTHIHTYVRTYICIYILNCVSKYMIILTILLHLERKMIFLTFFFLHLIIIFYKIHNLTHQMHILIINYLNLVNYQISDKLYLAACKLQILNISYLITECES